MGNAQSVGAGSYPLQRNLNAAARLNHQHYEFKEETGYIIVPRLLENAKRGFRVADIGTGTGIVAADLIQVLPPTAQIHGFDLSSDQFPPDCCLPNNVKLHGGFDLFEPVPEKLKGYFDVVHVRYISSVVTEDNASVVVANLTSMLKPGGWLQWTEAGLDEIRVSAPPGRSSVFLQFIVDGIHKLRDPKGDASQWKWIQGLWRSFRDEGLTDEMKITLAPRRAPYTFYRTQGLLLASEELCSAVYGSNDDVQAKWTGMRTKARLEMSLGAVASWPLIVSIGRKPLVEDGKPASHQDA